MKTEARERTDQRPRPAKKARVAEASQVRVQVAAARARGHQGPGEGEKTEEGGDHHGPLHGDEDGHDEGILQAQETEDRRPEGQGHELAPHDGPVAGAAGKEEIQGSPSAFQNEGAHRGHGEEQEKDDGQIAIEGRESEPLVVVEDGGEENAPHELEEGEDEKGRRRRQQGRRLAAPDGQGRADAGPSCSVASLHGAHATSWTRACHPVPR